MKKFSEQQCYSSIDEAIASFKDSQLDAPLAIKQQSIAARNAARFFSTHEHLATCQEPRAKARGVLGVLEHAQELRCLLTSQSREFAHAQFLTYRDFLRYIAWYSWPTRFVEGASYGIYDVLRREARLGEKTIQCIKRHIERKCLREYFEPEEVIVIAFPCGKRKYH